MDTMIRIPIEQFGAPIQIKRKFIEQAEQSISKPAPQGAQLVELRSQTGMLF
jgi:hypothetical protein